MGFEQETKNGKTYYKSTNELAWRVVSESSKIIMIDEIEGYTYTMKDVFMGGKFKDVMKHIKDNSLDISTAVISDFEDFKIKASKGLDPEKDKTTINEIELFKPINI